MIAMLAAKAPPDTSVSATAGIVKREAWRLMFIPYIDFW
jgi:hypothetical protein